MQIEALVPPNPYELVSAILLTESLQCFGTGTKSKSISGSVDSKFNVGGSIPCLTASTVKAASSEPAAPKRCPVAPLVEDTLSEVLWLPNSFLIAAHSTLSPSGVDVA